MPVGQQLPMRFSYVTGSAAWRKEPDEEGVWSLELAENGTVGAGPLELSELLREEAYENHGWWMWSSWYLVGLLLLVTTRYAKKTWTFSLYLHALLGYFTLIVTIVFSLKVTKW